MVRRGVVGYCVLALPRDGERSALDLVRDPAGTGGLAVSEGTIYPLLARLRREQRVETTWRESDAGPPRRNYRLTNTGRGVLTDFAQDWARFRDAVDPLLIPEEHHVHGTP